MTRFEQNYQTRKLNAATAALDSSHKLGKVGKIARDLILTDPNGEEIPMTRAEAIEFMGNKNVTGNLNNGVKSCNVRNRFTDEVYKVRYQ